MLSLLLLAGCRDTGSETGAPPTGPEWALMADQVGTGVFLSGFSDGATLRIVGGDLSGGGGVMAEVSDGTLCVSPLGDHALWWIHGAAEGEWYAVGEAGTILHHAAGTLTDESVDTAATLYGVYDDGARVWAVGGVPGATGELWLRENGAWTLHTGGIDGAVFKVWGSWFVGETGSWRLEDDALVAWPTGERLLTVRGSDDDAWAVGGATSARVMHFDGTAWIQEDAAGLGQPLNGVWTDTDRPVFIAGNFGTSAYRDGTDWVMPDWPVTSEHFHAVWWHDDAAWFLGGNLLTPGNNYGTIARYGDPIPALSVSDACP
jgi:hypothetical protein